MIESVFFRPISIIFSVICFIESLIWSILSFLAILCVDDAIKYNRDGIQDDLKQFTQDLYDLYFSGIPYFPTDSRAIDQKGFHAIISIYFSISLFMCFSSAVHLSVLMQNSKTRKLNVSTTIFLILSYTSILYDFICSIIFGLDYHKLRNYKAPFLNSSDHELLLTGPILLMVLSAKGFILWVVNLVFSIFITVLFLQKSEGENFLWVKPSVDPSVYARNNVVVYDAYAETEQPVHDESGVVIDQEKPPVQETWFSKITLERFKLSNLFGNADDLYRSKSDGTKSTKSWSHLPRANSVTSFKERPYISSPILDYHNSRAKSASPVYQSVFGSSAHETRPKSPIRDPSEPDPDYSPPVNRKDLNTSNSLPTVRHQPPFRRY